MKPTTLIIALAGLTTGALAASPDHKQEVLRPAHHMPQRVPSPLSNGDDDGLRVPIMKAEAGKGARDAKMVILGVAGAAGFFALGLL